MQEKGNIDLAIRYYLIAIEVCMQFSTNNYSLYCFCFIFYYDFECGSPVPCFKNIIVVIFVQQPKVRFLVVTYLVLI